MPHDSIALHQVSADPQVPTAVAEIRRRKVSTNGFCQSCHPPIGTRLSNPGYYLLYSFMQQ